MKKCFVIGFVILGLMLSCCTSYQYPSKQTYEYDRSPNPKPLNKTKIPVPIFDDMPELVDFYWIAWQLAWNHVKTNKHAPQSPYMDEAHWKDTIWIWDTCFMVHFCKYAPDIFPGVESLNNFYEPMHAAKKSSLFIHHPDNPPLFAWSEYANYKMTGDKKRIRKVLEKYLVKHYEWFENAVAGTKYDYAGQPLTLQKTKYGFRWRGVQSGMDNTRRGRGDFNSIYWLDALAQQGLSAYYISKLAIEIDDKKLAVEYQKKYNEIKELINSYYWCEEDGIYYDISVENPDTQVKVKTPAAYWSMLAMMCDDDQAKSLYQYAENDSVFGGNIPWASLSRDDPEFESKGMYWRGGVWLPTAYMSIKALENYGYYKTANKTAYNLLKDMYKVYIEVEPHTIWEAYSPTEAKPATKKENKHYARQDFCGWSALGPISLFIENVLGFHTIDAINNRVEWNLHQTCRHGIQNLRFGKVVTDIVYDDGKIKVNSNRDYALVVNGFKYLVKAGVQDFEVTK